MSSVCYYHRIILDNIFKHIFLANKTIVYLYEGTINHLTLFEAHVGLLRFCSLFTNDMTDVPFITSFRYKQYNNNNNNRTSKTNSINAF